MSLPTTIVTSSVPSSVAGHMMYPGAHTVMYATPTPSLSDGGLTVLNTFSQASHAQSHDAGEPATELQQQLIDEGCTTSGLGHLGCEWNSQNKHRNVVLYIYSFTCIHFADAFIQSDFQERALQKCIGHWS